MVTDKAQSESGIRREKVDNENLHLSLGTSHACKYILRSGVFPPAA